MAVKWGNTTCTVIKWGSTTCTAVYWGSTKVWPDSPFALLSDPWIEHKNYYHSGSTSTTTVNRVNAASYTYFNKDVSKINLAEAEL